MRILCKQNRTINGVKVSVSHWKMVRIWEKSYFFLGFPFFVRTSVCQSVRKTGEKQQKSVKIHTTCSCNNLPSLRGNNLRADFHSSQNSSLLFIVSGNKLIRTIKALVSC